jgi:DNA-binding NtrC family response regulator
MLVKDDIALRELVEEYLASAGHSVRSFDSAEEAFCYFKPNHYDVVVTDYHLPDRNGIDFVKDIRKVDHEVGVVITTADKSPYVSEQCDGLHVWSVITEPSNFDLLLEKIQEAHEFAHLDDSFEQQIFEDLSSEVCGIRKVIKDVRSLLL